MKCLDFGPIGFRDEEAISERLVLLADLMSVEMGDDKEFEHAHIVADDVLIEAIRALGQFAGRETYTERLITFYKEVGKWYA